MEETITLLKMVISPHSLRSRWIDGIPYVAPSFGCSVWASSHACDNEIWIMTRVQDHGRKGEETRRPCFVPTNHGSLTRPWALIRSRHQRFTDRRMPFYGTYFAISSSSVMESKRMPDFGLTIGGPVLDLSKSWMGNVKSLSQLPPSNRSAT